MPGSEYFIVFIPWGLFSCPFFLWFLHIRTSGTNFSFPSSSLTTWLYCRAGDKEGKILRKPFHLKPQMAANQTQRIRKKTTFASLRETLKFFYQFMNYISLFILQQHRKLVVSSIPGQLFLSHICIEISFERSRVPSGIKFAFDSFFIGDYTISFCS